MGHTPRGSSVDHAASAASLHPVTVGPVFIVDDDAVAVAVLARFLSGLHLANPIVRCTDGDDAVARLEQAASNPSTPPVLALVDRHMPKRSGIEVVKWMRTHAALRNVPVVKFSATSDMEAIQQGYSLGIASYLVKPVACTA